MTTSPHPFPSFVPLRELLATHAFSFFPVPVLQTLDGCGHTPMGNLFQKAMSTLDVLVASREWTPGATSWPHCHPAALTTSPLGASLSP